MANTQAERLEELRTELRNGSISYGELAELQGLSGHIQDGDVELLEAAGVPEHAPTQTEILSRVSKLTLELFGWSQEDDTSFWCVQEFWDCECGGNERAYIHLKEACTDCCACGCDDPDDQPDSRLIEVLDAYPGLYDVPWVNGSDGTEVDKLAVTAQMQRYIDHCKKAWNKPA